MRRRIIAIIILIGLGVVLFKVMQPTPIWEGNAQKLKEATAMQVNETIVSLNEVAPFEWDRLYTFRPYTPKEKIYEVIGYKWDKINETVNEGMNQVVFMDKGKVVCYVYGYSDNLGYGFNFGAFEGDYLQLDSSERPLFIVGSANNTVYFTYEK